MQFTPFDIFLQVFNKDFIWKCYKLSLLLIGEYFNDFFF